MDAAIVAMEGGDALRWFQWVSGRTPAITWDDLTARILQQFRPMNLGSLHEQWLATVQTTTVLENRKSFIEMSAPLKDVPDSLLMGQFINGLKDEIKAEVRVLNPFTLEETMDAAARVEERNRIHGLKRTSNPPNNQTRPGSYSNVGRGTTMGGSFTVGSGNETMPYGGGSSYSGPSSQPINHHQTQNKINPAPSSVGYQISVNYNKPASTHTRPTGGFRCLTERELQEKKAKGLCFKCDGKWEIRHS